MAPRRRPTPRRRPRDDGSFPWTSVLAGTIVAFCLCAFHFDAHGTSPPRQDACRTACEARLRSAAAWDGPVPPASLSPPAAGPPFLRPRARDHRAVFEGRSDVGAARPRRLPPLIKVLTGFGDEHTAVGAGHKAARVRIDRPTLPAPARGGAAGPRSHERTVEAAAAAAAAAVFAQSFRVACRCRMERVNAEWDAALRWIAGWDARPPHPPGRPTRHGTGSSETASNDPGREGFDSLVHDLARTMEECIAQCTDDEDFDARRREEGEYEVSIGGRSWGNIVAIGGLLLRSLCGWVMGASLPKLSLAAADRAIVVQAFRWVSSSLTAYALVSLWGWAHPALSQWYSSLGYTESPEWLLQHERELKEATSSRARQKKKRRKAAGRRAATSHAGAQKESGFDAKPAPVRGLLDRPTDHGPAKEATLANPSTEQPPTPVPDSKDSVTGSQDSSNEGIPSIISYTTVSTTSSPSIKPIGSHLEGGSPYTAGLQGPPQPIPRLHAPLGRTGPLFPPPPTPKPLAVPTQAQREAAAKQLREFQHARIQQLILRKKLSRSGIASAPRGPRAMTPQSSALTAGSSFHSAEKPSVASSGRPAKVLRPPPGLSHPSAAPSNPIPLGQDDAAFLADNERLLSKLLDDDEDEDVADAPPEPLDLGIESMVSAEPSLDPSAAPFVATVAAKEGKGDAWQSGPSELLDQKSPVRMGVYGGSVW